jgi:hypothetical protein
VITSNPFAELAAVIPPSVMQAYLVLMVILVAGGTILDVLHKKSARYFVENAKTSPAERTAAALAAVEKVGLIAVKTLGKEVLTAGEFANRAAPHVPPVSRCTASFVLA